MAAQANSTQDRVGNAWDSFTQLRHNFYNFDLEGVRRLFISVAGKAVHEGGSLSWSNRAQVEAAKHLLQALYAHRSSTGEQIRPHDVMVVSAIRTNRGL